jgi:hypothetical protein
MSPLRSAWWAFRNPGIWRTVESLKRIIESDGRHEEELQGKLAKSAESGMWWQGRANSVEVELATSRAANEQLRAKLAIAERPKTPKNRGVVVNRTTAAGAIIDEWATGDSWKLRIVPAVGDTPEEAWLLVLDVQGRRVATYKPGYWDMVEAGRADDIKIKAEAEPAS